jgi:hypothetical protein
MTPQQSIAHYRIVSKLGEGGMGALHTTNYADPSIGGSRLYPSRDGKRLLGSRWEPRASVWLLEGVTPPRPWWKLFQ